MIPTPEMIEAACDAYANGDPNEYPSKSGMKYALTAALALIPGEPVAILAKRDVELFDVNDTQIVAATLFPKGTLRPENEFPVYAASQARTCEGADDPEERCPKHPSECTCWQVDNDHPARKSSASPAPLPVAVKVKPLEWREESIPPAGEIVAPSPIGLYCVKLGAQNFYPLWLRDKVQLGYFTTIEEAKAAAQADYESRIRSSLSYPVEGRTEKECRHCKGKGYQPGDPEGAPIESCDYCGGIGSSLPVQNKTVTANEIIDFLYKHGDLTHSAAARAVQLLTGNGYGFTSSSEVK